jgi:hypothetical protein
MQNGCPYFYDTALLAPSFGVKLSAMPTCPVATALRTLCYLIPSVGILTPIEHQQLTNAHPKRWRRSQRQTCCRSVLSVKVENQMEGLVSLEVIMGDKEEIIPLQSVAD